MKVAALLLAAGRSQRYGSDKLAEAVGGIPVWEMAYRAFASHPEVDAVGLVVSEDRLQEVRERAPGALFHVLGGASRQESALAGLRALPEEYEIVLVHDAARPFVSAALISRVIAGVREAGAAFPALPVTDTIKRVGEGGVETLNRASLVAVQTPQGATRSFFLRAHEACEDEATDDMALVERLGVKPKAVPGEPANVKLTSPGDLDRALGRSGETRTGLGYDVHAFSKDPDRPLWLGGVLFDEKPGLEGHSDADALIHAIVDALLGAANLGDIGQRYPDTDPRLKNAASETFLADVGRLVKAHGWSIMGIDATVIAERPRLSPRRAEICGRVAEILEMDPQRVSLKATTNERLGAIGRGEGVAAFAVATLSRS